MIGIWLRNRARRSPLLLAAYLRWIGLPEIGVVPGRTDLCIEAFPRSANSSTYRKFMIANPGAIVAHHTHTVANVAAAVRHGVPALVLIRRPPDALLSALVAQRKPSPDDVLARYVDFHRWLADHVDGVVLADFETVLSDWNGVIERVNDRFGTSFATHADAADADRQMEDFIRAKMDAEARSRHATNMPLPSPERSGLKESFREVVESHPLYPAALAAYERLRPHCVKTR